MITNENTFVNWEENMNPFYEMFNQQYIQQQAQQYHMSQVWQVQESSRKLKDFLDSLDKIDPPYQDAARREFCAILFDFFVKQANK